MTDNQSAGRASALPQHVGIIMDGNGRWAKKHGLPRNRGHKQGANAFGDIVRHAKKLGIRYLTVYAFSTENWRRPPEEVRGIMDILYAYLKDAGEYGKENIRLVILGDRQPLDRNIRALIGKLERETRGNGALTVNIALNYGGRDEILRAVRLLWEEPRSGAASDPPPLDEGRFARYLYTAGQPDVDLVIRTGGEKRISNFLLWQSAYAEYVFTDVLWPDFTSGEFDKALLEFAGRTRRMGGL